MSTGAWPPPGPGPQMQESMGVQATWSRAAYELRPLTLGEILDRTFGVYRAHFWLFVGIGSLSGAVQFLANAVQLLVYHGIRIQPRATLNYATMERQIGPAVAGLLYFLAAAVTQAAIVWALSEVYLGKPASILNSVRVVIGRWFRFFGIALWQAWSFMWLPALLIVPGALLVMPRPWAMPWVGGVLLFLGFTGALAFGAIAFIRNSLAVPAAVIEGLKVRPAMRRSKVLAAGAKGRIFVVFLIAFCLYLVAGMLNAPLALFVGLGAMRGEQHVLAQAAMLVVNFVAHTMVAPVAMIGLSLVYFDQRVRQEALDLLLMLGGSPGAGTAQQTEEAAGKDDTQTFGPAGNATAF